MKTMRPEICAGPIRRSFRPLNVAVEKGSAGFSSLFGSGAGLGGSTFWGCTSFLACGGLVFFSCVNPKVETRARQRMALNSERDLGKAVSCKAVEMNERTDV